MRHSTFALLCVLSAVAFAAACGSNPTGPSGTNPGGSTPGGSNVQNVHSCGGGTASGNMSATINGTSFVATCLDAVSVVNGIIGFGGTNVSQNNASNFTDISIALQASAPGMFQLANLTPNNAAVSIGGSQIWLAGAASTGTGSVILKVLSATEVSGTFTLNLVAGPGGSGTKTVTNGSFDITF